LPRVIQAMVRSCAARDEQVEPRDDGGFEETGGLSGQRAERDQLVEVVGLQTYACSTARSPPRRWPERSSSGVRRGMLVDGQDPFVDPDAPAGLSCRVYRMEVAVTGRRPSTSWSRCRREAARPPIQRRRVHG
jgi:hypothetical protein